MTAAVAVAPSIPGPPPWPWLGNSLGFRWRTHEYLRRLAAQYGDVVHFRLGRRDAFLLNHPDLVREVHVEQASLLRRGYTMQRAKRILDEGLLTSEGAFHREQRRVVHGCFHKARLRSAAEVVRRRARGLAERWSEGVAIDIYAQMNQLALEVTAENLLGIDLTEDAPELNREMHFLATWFPVLVLPLFEQLEELPVPIVRRTRRALDLLNATLLDRLAARRAAPERFDDLLGDLVRAAPEMPDDQIRSEALALFLAGYETTAIAMAWTFYLVARHPKVESSLVQEVRRHAGEPDSSQLELTGRVFSESLRLYPPIARLGRRPTEPIQAGGYTLPKDAVVFISPYVMHRDPRYFPDPDRFDPERFTPEAVAARPRYAYLPFGLGPRMCIGDRLARVIGVTALAEVLGGWHLALESASPVRAQGLATLKPTRAIRMIPRARGDKPASGPRR